jgi:hypothetical protein
LAGLTRPDAIRHPTGGRQNHTQAKKIFKIFLRCYNSAPTEPQLELAGDRANQRLVQRNCVAGDAVWTGHQDENLRIRLGSNENRF